MSVQVDIIRQVVEVQVVEDKIVQVAIWNGISVLEDGELIGPTRAIDFVAGSNITISVQEIGTKIQVTVNSTASGAAVGTWGSITGTLSDQTDLNTALGLKAALASPTFTGTPAAPTAADGTNTTQLATTAFVQSAVMNLYSDFGSNFGHNF